MRPLIVAIGFALVAARTVPDARDETQADELAWPLPAMKAAALGRPFAAANVAWLKTIQLIGSADYERRGFPTLDGWLEVITSLDPSFEDPYFLGATLLVTDSSRTLAVERLLARGEAAAPDVFSFALMRGFVAQFGALDPQAAAAHYRRAAAMKNAPSYLTAHAERLERERVGCANVFDDLSRVSVSPAAQAASLERSGAIFEHCVAGMIRRAAVQYRMQTGRPATVAALVKEGTIEDPPRPPGRCWTIEHDRPRLIDCLDEPP